MDEAEARARGIDTSKTHPARRYNYFLGGTDHFPVDRESGELLERVSSSAKLTAVENRRFLGRAVRYLAGTAGVDQFLDIGTGLPTAENTHQVAQAANPAARVVYVDNDPMVLAYAETLLTGTPQGRCRFFQEDLLHPERILDHPDVRDTLDLSRPVALMVVAVLHFIESDSQAHAAVRTLLDALPPGSYFVSSHMTADFITAEAAVRYEQLRASGQLDAYARTKDEFATFFTGLDLVDPGVVPISEWRSPLPPDQRLPLGQVAGYCAVARKP